MKDPHCLVVLPGSNPFDLQQCKKQSSSFEARSAEGGHPGRSPYSFPTCLLDTVAGRQLDDLLRRLLVEVAPIAAQANGLALDLIAQSVEQRLDPAPQRGCPSFARTTQTLWLMLVDPSDREGCSA